MTPTTALILYVLLTVGAVGVYFLLPRSGRSLVRPGAVFGLFGLVGLLILLLTSVVLPAGTGVYFCIFACVAIGGACRVVTHPRPVYSAIYFVLLVVAVAAMLVLLGAEFLAVALIIIYAGAILVTYAFVIMLAQQGPSTPYDRQAREPALAVLAGFVLAGAIAGRAGELAGSTPADPPAQMAATSIAETPQEADALREPGNTEKLGAVIITKYVVALEIAGVLLLIAMVGAIALSRKRVPTERWEEPRRPLGEVGRKVEPF